MILYLRLLSAGMRARMQYKADFILTMFLYALGASLEFLTLAAILYRYPRIGGWNIYEIAVLSGIGITSYGLFRLFGQEVNNFERYLVSGEFDSLLIRPWPSLTSLLSRNFDLARIGSTLQGILLMVYGLQGVVAAGAPAWVFAYTLLMPVAGTFVVGALALATAAAGFWLTRIDELSVFTLNAPVTASQYPMNIFPGWMRRMLTVVLPVACIGFIPLNYAFGKGGQAWHLTVPFLAAAGAAWVSLRFWLWGERHYQSTGS